jgi:DNA-binding MarR family transcriptional regulator
MWITSELIWFDWRKQRRFTRLGPNRACMASVNEGLNDVKLPDKICGQLVRSVLEGAMQTLDPQVTLVHLRALQDVARAHFSGEKIGVTEVAKNLGITMSTASRLLAQLGDFEPGGMGFITQVSHPKDRRRVILAPTELGLRARQKHLDYISASISPLIAEFCKQQQP